MGDGRRASPKPMEHYVITSPYKELSLSLPGRGVSVMASAGRSLLIPPGSSWRSGRSESLAAAYQPVEECAQGPGCRGSSLVSIMKAAEVVSWWAAISCTQPGVWAKKLPSRSSSLISRPRRGSFLHLFACLLFNLTKKVNLAELLRGRYELQAAFFFFLLL